MSCVFSSQWWNDVHWTCSVYYSQNLTSACKSSLVALTDGLYHIKWRLRHSACLYLLFTGGWWFPFFALDVASTRRESHDMKTSHSSLYKCIASKNSHCLYFLHRLVLFVTLCFFIRHLCLVFFLLTQHIIICNSEFALDVSAYVNVINNVLLIVLLCTSIVLIIPTACDVRWTQNSVNLKATVTKQIHTPL